MAGLLDNIFPGGLLGELFGRQYQQQQQQQQQQGQDAYAQAPAQQSGYMQQPMQQAQAPDFGSRLSAGLGSYSNSSGILDGLMNMTQGLSTGQRSDPLAVQQRTIAAALSEMPNITAAQRRMILNDPSAWKELAKATISPQTINNGQTTLVAGPGGQLRPGYIEPYKPELKEGVTPAGEKYWTPVNIPLPHFGGALNPQVAPAAAAPGSAPGSARGPAPGGAPQRSAGLPQGAFMSEISPQARQELEGAGKGLAEQYTDIQKQSLAATKMLTTLRRMSQLDPKAFEGAAAPALQYARSALVTFGILNPGKVPAGEEFTAIRNKAVLDINNGSLGPGVSNADVIYLNAQIPSLDMTGPGRRELIETLSTFKKREQDVGRMAYEYRKGNNGSIDGFNNWLTAWAEQNPLFAGRGPPPAAAAPPGKLQAAENSQLQTRTGNAPTLPKVGDTQGGYKFLGGNPADPKSWEKH